MGPGGGGGRLRPLVHLRGGGREHNGPRHLLRGQYYGPLHRQSYPQHYGRTRRIGEGGGEAGGGDGGQYHQHHYHPHQHRPHHHGAPQQLYTLHHLHRCEEGGGAPGQGAQQSGGNGVYILLFFVKHSIEYITVLHSTFCTVYYRTVFIYFIVQYIILYKLFRRPAAFHHLWCWCWWWRPWGSGWG